MPNPWYSFTAKADSAELSIYDVIGDWGISAMDFVSQLRAVEGKPLTVRINSPGGEITDGVAIFNSLKRHKGGLTVQIDGLAASMASYIALAGAPIKMAENAFMMIHNPGSIVMGTSDDMRDMAVLLDKMRDMLANTYAAKTGKSFADIKAAMDKETWFTAQEAQDYGLVDEITDKINATNCFNLSQYNFRNAPKGLATNQKTKEKNMTIESLQASLGELTATHAALETQHNETKALLATAQADAVAANALLVEANASIQSITAERDSAKADLVTEKASVVAVTADRDKLKAEATTVEMRAAIICAAAGVDALKVTAALENVAEPMNRASFEKLTDSKKQAFIRAGGKLVD